MTSTIRYFSIALLLTGFLAACGGSGSDQQQQMQQQAQQEQEQARQDSIAQAKADSVARTKTDSVAKARKQAKKEKQKTEKGQLTLQDISFNPNGAFSVQVGAWRSQEKAEAQTSIWKKRGFSNAFVVKYGKEGTGNIWFRVRLGRVADRATAEKLTKLLKMKYNENSWISEAKSSS